CPTPTAGLAGWMDFTPPVWLNPDFKPEFRHPWVIRPLSRGCHGDVSGLKGSARIPLPPLAKARRVGRSTQTHLDAYHQPLCADGGGARQRWNRGGVAAVARPGRPADHRAARSAYRRRHPRRGDLRRPLRVRREDRDLPWPLDLRSRTAIGRLGSGAARLWLAAAPSRRRHRADPRQRPFAGRRLDLESGPQAAARAPRRRAGAPRDLAVIAGA